jgi:aryl-alcohol dehydrogenase-like predicted oxidoreductase
MNGFIARLMRDDVLEAVQRLRPIAHGAGLTMSQLALAWVLRRPNVAAAIVGATRPEQVHENAGAAELELAPDVVEAVETALEGVAVR